MTFIYYRVLNSDNKEVFNCITDDIYLSVYYGSRWWELRHLISHFIDNECDVNTEEFTSEELNNWLSQRNNKVNK